MWLGIWGQLGLLLLTLFAPACLESPLPPVHVPPAKAPTHEAPDPAARHVLIITIDTLRADALGCMGHPDRQTPNIDRLAGEGILFLDNSTTATTTLPAHASLFTGLYPNRHGAAHNNYTLPPGVPTLAELLAEWGIPSAGFVGALPLRRRFGLARGFAVWDEPPPPKERGLDERSAAAVTDAALAWLSTAPEGRWMAFVHYWDPHAPYTPPPPFDALTPREDPTITGSFIDIDRLRLARGRGEDIGAALRSMQALYWGEVAYVDQELGRLVAGLRALNLFDDTLIVITADHGESMGEHEELFDHGYTVYQESAHTPLIVRQPGARGGGAKVQAPVSLVDIAPTVLDRLGVEIPAEMQGRSLASLLDGAADAPHTPLYVEANRPQARWMETGIWPNSEKCAAVRVEGYKYIRCPYRELEALFSLDVDPAEATNLLGRRGDDAVIGPLSAALTEHGSGPVPALMRIDDEGTVEALRALGYIDPEP